MILQSKVYDKSVIGLAVDIAVMTPTQISPPPTHKHTFPQL